MLNKKMTLNEMINFMPGDDEMLSLPLEDVVYLKVSLISLNKEDNYDFIRFFLTDEEITNYINNINETIFYDFDGTQTNQEKFITIFELTSKINYHELAIYLEELLNSYSHEADVIIDMFTQDSKKYRLANLYGIVKLDELKS